MLKNVNYEARMRKNATFGALERENTGLRICSFGEIDSTNAQAKRMVADGFDGEYALLAARQQSAGRGRMGRSFFSPADTGAYFSLLCRVHTPLCEAVTVTSAASVAVMRAIRTLTGLQTQIKWVNDLYLNDKKICGILTETTGIGEARFLIVGIGINISTEQFPSELQGVAGSIGADHLSSEALITEVCRALLPYLKDPADRSWLSDYRAHSCVLGRRVQWICEGRGQVGTAEEIDEAGALLIRTDTGESVRLFSGEITIRNV